MVAETQYERANEAFFEEQDYEKVVTIATDALKKLPNQVQFLKIRADSYRGMGEAFIEDELQDRLKVAELLPDDDTGKWFVLEEVALTYERLGQIDKAWQYRQKVINLRADHPDTIKRQYIDIGEACERLEDYRKAIDFYTKAVDFEQASGGYPVALEKRVNLHQKLDDHQAVINDYNLLIDSYTDENEHDELHARLNLGKFYANQLNDYDQAIAVHTIIIDRVPRAELKTADPFSRGFDAYLAYKERAMAHYSQRDYQAALRDIDIYIEMFDGEASSFESDAHAHTVRALIYINLNQHRKALVDLDRAIELDEYQSLAYVNRAMLRRTFSEDYEGAFNDADRAIQLNSTSAHTYAQRGLAALVLNRFSIASRDLAQAVTMKPNWSEMCYYYALAAAQYGEIKKAKQGLQRVIRDTEDRELRRQAEEILSQL